MKIQEQDVYLGPALAQIVEHQSYKSVNKADTKYGHYILNHDRRLMLKFATTQQPWKFTFAPDDLLVLGHDVRLKPARTFLVLACAHETVCVLTDEQFESLIDVWGGKQQTIVVTYPKGGGMRVAGTVRPLKRVVPHEAFPRVIFE